MQIALIFHESPEDLGAREDPARAPAHRGAWRGYVAALTEAGLLRGGNALMPPATGRRCAAAAAPTRCSTGPTPTRAGSWAAAS
jgi:hypothetical protein